MHSILNRRPQRAAASGRTLSALGAAIVKGMLLRGDRQHDVAAHFGVNAGRVADIATGKKFIEVVAADPASLPEPGSFFSLLDRAALVNAIQHLRELIEDLTHILRSLEKLAPK